MTHLCKAGGKQSGCAKRLVQQIAGGTHLHQHTAGGQVLVVVELRSVMGRISVGDSSVNRCWMAAKTTFSSQWSLLLP